MCDFETRHRPARPEADLRSRPSEERVHNLIKTASRLGALQKSAQAPTFSSVVLVGFNRELHSTTASTAGDVSPTTSRAGQLRGRMRMLVTFRFRLQTETFCRGLRTYVSVLTVSSFRPTTGRSISRSRRLCSRETNRDLFVPLSQPYFFIFVLNNLYFKLHVFLPMHSI